MLLAIIPSSFGQFNVNHDIIINNTTAEAQQVYIKMLDTRMYNSSGNPLPSQTCSNPEINVTTIVVPKYTTTTTTISVNPNALLAVNRVTSCAVECSPVGNDNSCATFYWNCNGTIPITKDGTYTCSGGSFKVGPSWFINNTTALPYYQPNISSEIIIQ